MNDHTIFRGMLLPALLIWIFTILALGHWLRQPTAASAPPTLDAQLIQLPLLTPPAATPTPARQPTQTTPHAVKQQTAKTTATRPLPPTPIPVKTPPIATTASPHILTTAPTSLAPIVPNMPPSHTTASTPAKTQPETDSSDQNDTEAMGAQAIYQPTPVIPEELRDNALHVKILARFHITTDGSVNVELVHPAPDPRINRIILDTLKTWRFFPATEQGKPVPATQDLEINIGAEQ